MTLTIHALDHVRQVAETGSYAAAARQMGLTQPAVSQQIRNIEAKYGVSLFSRVNGRLISTPLCNRLCDIAERVIRDQTAAEQMLERHGSLAHGDISVGLGNAMPGMSVIAEFNKAYPQVTLRVETGSHDKIIRQVLNHEVDVGILPDIPENARFQRKVLLVNEVVAIVALGHPLARARDITCQDLLRQQLIFRSKGSSTQRVVDRYFKRRNVVPRPFLALDTRDGVYEAVVNGMGVGFVWKTGTGRTNDVIQLKLSDQEMQSEEVVFAPKDRQLETVSALFSMIESWHQ